MHCWTPSYLVLWASLLVVPHLCRDVVVAKIFRRKVWHDLRAATGKIHSTITTV